MVSTFSTMRAATVFDLPTSISLKRVNNDGAATIHGRQEGASAGEGCFDGYWAFTDQGKAASDDGGGEAARAVTANEGFW